MENIGPEIIQHLIQSTYTDTHLSEIVRKSQIVNGRQHRWVCIQISKLLWKLKSWNFRLLSSKDTMNIENNK